MRMKLDENLGRAAEELLRQHGHDVETVASQNLCGAQDSELIAICRTEQRCLVTLDAEFGNPLRFRPSQYEGIVVLRLPRKPAAGDLSDAVETFAGALARGDLKGKLWTVQKGRIRIHQDPRDE